MFNFQFLQEVGESITWGEFSAQCWNLALLYFGFEIIKWVDVKFEKIFRRMGKEN
jgi:hypothetical protein